DVEEDVDPLLVRGPDKLAELRAGPEVRIDVEEVLDPVAVVARLERDLPEDGADPQRGDTELPEGAEFALQARQRAALPVAAGAEPVIVIDPTAVLGPVQRRGAGPYRAVFVIPVAVFFLAVGETVHQEEVQDLVLPGGR